VNPDYLVPVGFLGFGEGLVQQDACVVHQDIGAAEILDGVVEYRLAAGDGRNVSAVGDRLAALRLDRINHLLRHRRVAAGTVARTAEIVDHDRRTLAGKQFGVGLAEPAARTRDDRNLAVE
jgi:hypothetical protein